jgi:hypothetical protein
MQKCWEFSNMADLVRSLLGQNWSDVSANSLGLFISHILAVDNTLRGSYILLNQPPAQRTWWQQVDPALAFPTALWLGITCPQKAAACKGSHPSQSFTSTRTPWSRRSSAARRYPFAPAMCSWKRGQKWAFHRGPAPYLEAGYGPILKSQSILGSAEWNRMRGKYQSCCRGLISLKMWT